MIKGDWLRKRDVVLFGKERGEETLSDEIKTPG